MKIQILNAFFGDKEKEFDTSKPEERTSAAKLISELLRSGSGLFLEKEINGVLYTYRVMGYDEQTDKLKVAVHLGEEKTVKHRGPYKTGRQVRSALIESDAGRLVSVAPVAGGSCGRF